VDPVLFLYHTYLARRPSAITAPILKCPHHAGISGTRCNRGSVLLAKQLIEQAGTGIEKLFDQALAGHGRYGLSSDPTTAAWAASSE
jgi:hypothetical protein